MDGFRMCVALGPLAMYLLVLAAINLCRRPFLISGGRDRAALGVGVSGLVLIGPVELLLPDDAARVYQANVWLLLLTMYALCVALVALMARPRLTIYNFTLDQFRPMLAEAIDALDPDARWAGGSLALPKLRVELHLETDAALRNLSLVASGGEQSYAGWRSLERELAARLKAAETSSNPWGVLLAIVSLVMVSAVGWQLVVNPRAVTASLRAMLRL
jgi:hypothetical protein